MVKLFQVSNLVLQDVDAIRIHRRRSSEWGSAELELVVSLPP